MSAGPIVFLTDTPAQTEARLRTDLPDLDFRPLPVAAAPERLQSSGATAAVVYLNGDPEAAFRLVRSLEVGGVRPVVVGARKDADLILRALREGAKEYVLAGDDAALSQALRQQVRPAQPAGGTVCAVFAAKGGVGATTLATNLAGALQARGDRTCLVDLNLNMGDVLAFLDLAGGYSIADVVQNMHRLDRQLLDASLLRHASGIHVIAQSHRVEDAEHVTPEALASLLRFLRQDFGSIVLDGLRNFDDLSLAALDASDRILLLLTQEIPAVRDARRCVDLFRRLGCQDRLVLVVNRYQKSEIDLDVIAETVGIPVAATVANDYPAVIRAVNRGVLVLDEAPRGPVTRDVASVAGRLVARAPAPAPAKVSMLTRFFGGRGARAAG